MASASFPYHSKHLPLIMLKKTKDLSQDSSLLLEMTGVKSSHGIGQMWHLVVAAETDPRQLNLLVPQWLLQPLR